MFVGLGYKEVRRIKEGCFYSIVLKCKLLFFSLLPGKLVEKAHTFSTLNK